MHYLASHPRARLDRQRRQAQRRVCAAEQRTYKVPSTVKILAIARAQRERPGGASPGPFGAWVAPKRPTEDELLRRLFPPRQVRKPGRQDRTRFKQIERARSPTGRSTGPSNTILITQPN